MRVSELEKSLKAFHNGPNSNQSLVEGAVLISQWGQVEQEKLVTLSEVKAALDSIAQRVIQVIADKHRNQKILKRNEMGEMEVDTNGNPELEKKVLICINDVLYREMGFCGNVEDYYNHDNSFIDKVGQHFQLLCLMDCQAEYWTGQTYVNWSSRMNTEIWSKLLKTVKPGFSNGILELEAD